MKKLTLEYVKKVSLDNGFEFLDPEYNGNLYKHNFRCLEHNEIHESDSASIMRGRGLRCCRYAFYKISGKRKMLPIEELKRKCEEFGFGFEFLDEDYNGSEAQHHFRCLKHNEIHLSSFYKLRKSKKLECCVIEEYGFTTKKLTLEEVKIRCEKFGFVFLEDDYNGLHQKYLLKCLVDNEIHLTDLSSVFQGRGLKCCGERKLSLLVGENHPNWNPNLSQSERIFGRNFPGLFKWTNDVKKRDNYECQVCGSKEKINAHHLRNYSDNEDSRTDVDNGISLCEKHHIMFHCEYGQKNTTKEQFEEFKKLKDGNNKNVIQNNSGRK